MAQRYSILKGLSAWEDEQSMNLMLHKMLCDDKREGMSAEEHQRRSDTISDLAKDIVATLESNAK